jgi:hypothetical protein
MPQFAEPTCRPGCGKVTKPNRPVLLFHCNRRLVLTALLNFGNLTPSMRVAFLNLTLLESNPFNHSNTNLRPGGTSRQEARFSMVHFWSNDAGRHHVVNEELSRRVGFRTRAVGSCPGLQPLGAHPLKEALNKLNKKLVCSFPASFTSTSSLLFPSSF